MPLIADKKNTIQDLQRIVRYLATLGLFFALGFLFRPFYDEQKTIQTNTCDCSPVFVTCTNSELKTTPKVIMKLPLSGVSYLTGK